MISEEEIKRRALHSVEQEGIVFIDEIDKICSRGDFRGSADASSEGVQRDLLPLLEGSVVSTKQVSTGAAKRARTASKLAASPPAHSFRHSRARRSRAAS